MRSLTEPKGWREEGLEVHGVGRVTTVQGVAGGMREPGEAMRTTVPGGVEGGRSQGAADWPKGQGEGTGSGAGDGARGSSLPR